MLRTIGLDVIFISRNPNTAKQFSYDEVNNYMLDACKLIVNTTPVGTFPDIDAVIDIPYEFLTEDHLVVDLIYNPEETKFLLNARLNGAEILNGSSMMKEQALKSWEIWNGNE